MLASMLILPPSANTSSGVDVLVTSEMPVWEIKDTFAAMIIQVKMRVIDRDQVHIAVQAAKDRKVTRQWHQRIDAVVHAQRHLIHAVIHVGADVKAES